MGGFVVVSLCAFLYFLSFLFENILLCQQGGKKPF